MRMSQAIMLAGVAIAALAGPEMAFAQSEPVADAADGDADAIIVTVSY